MCREWFNGINEMNDDMFITELRYTLWKVMQINNILLKHMPLCCCRYIYLLFSGLHLKPSKSTNMPQADYIIYCLNWESFSVTVLWLATVADIIIYASVFSLPNSCFYVS